MYSKRGEIEVSGVFRASPNTARSYLTSRDIKFWVWGNFFSRPFFHYVLYLGPPAGGAPTPAGAAARTRRTTKAEAESTTVEQRLAEANAVSDKQRGHMTEAIETERVGPCGWGPLPGNKSLAKPVPVPSARGESTVLVYTIGGQQ